MSEDKLMGPEEGLAYLRRQDNGARHLDEGKPRFDLIPPEAMEALAHHYTIGARKYADRNWERGMVWGRLFGSIMRHAWAWMRGENLDPETGSHHMIAVAWNAIALYCYAARNIGVDDRPGAENAVGCQELQSEA